MNDDNQAAWFDDYAEEEDDAQIDEYDITATPNDFNVITLYNFVESGAVRIPGFQRNFVSDRAKASRLIESLILGLPVPQLFLYEQARNRFLVIKRATAWNCRSTTSSRCVSKEGEAR